MLSGLFLGRVFIHSPSHEKRVVIGIPTPELKMKIIKQNSLGTVVGLDGSHCFGQAVDCDCWWRGVNLYFYRLGTATSVLSMEDIDN